jgi:hypothetical protein
MHVWAGLVPALGRTVYSSTLIGWRQSNSSENDKGGPNGPPLSAFPFPTNHLYGSCGALTGVIVLVSRVATAMLP